MFNVLRKDLAEFMVKRVFTVIVSMLMLLSVLFFALSCNSKTEEKTTKATTNEMVTGMKSSFMKG